MFFAVLFEDGYYVPFFPPLDLIDLYDSIKSLDDVPYEIFSFESVEALGAWVIQMEKKYYKKGG